MDVRLQKWGPDSITTAPTKGQDRWHRWNQGGESSIAQSVRPLHPPVHSNKLHRQGVGDELLLDGHRVLDDCLDPLLRAFDLAFGIQEAGKVAVQAFIPGDELVGESKALRRQDRDT